MLQNWKEKSLSIAVAKAIHTLIIRWNVSIVANLFMSNGAEYHHKAQRQYIYLLCTVQTIDGEHHW